ncbi:hypothetical protein QQS21_000043 [Conoideocrella luteorostrata]|uniref:Carboxylic ester hydrolase n=1 Tax=Conoideocrella luteorostrata TaxID=1105319 RepID=A0AAJ0FYT4_9HYPO|nr:hypothetical protein QQS21_000043 [Conoideocrella luteorostrata]
MKFSAVQLILSHVVGSTATICSNSSAPTATLDAGPIFGTTTQLPGAAGPVNKFLGIPYAENPERFALSKPPKKWTSPKNTTAFGPSCYQLSVTSDVGPSQEILDSLFNTHPKESEDCLFMNAFAPATQGPAGGRPVVLFIPGGGWVQGNGILDLAGFAGYEDIVAFTFNYRTNIFGFPNAGDLPLQERNLGLFDQQLAIRWVQQNAKAFGGDPSKVTIWGESAGSLSVDIHMHVHANSKKPPFRGAIMSSGEFSFGMLATTGSPNDTANWDNIAKASGCKDGKIECLRKVPAEKLLNTTIATGASFMPIQDNKAVPAGRASAWRQGKVAKVPVLAGTIAQEGRSLVNRNISLERFNQVYLSEPLVTKKKLGEIYQYYRQQPDLKSDFALASAIYTDLLWQCPMQKMTNVSASIKNPTWRYYFNISMVDRLPKQFDFLGKFHGSDVILLFLSPTYDDSVPTGALYTPMLSTFTNYWRGTIGKFVRNPTGGPGWPAVGSSYRPFDLVTLGDVGDAHAGGATPVNQTDVDTNCGVLWDVLDMYEKYSG